MDAFVTTVLDRLMAFQERLHKLEATTRRQLDIENRISDIQHEQRQMQAQLNAVEDDIRKLAKP